MVKSNALLKFIEAYSYEERIWEVLELMDGGALTNILEDSSFSYSENFCKYTLYWVLRAIIDLHRNNIYHRSIQSDNVLVSVSGEIKLGGLCFAAVLSKKQKRRTS